MRVLAAFLLALIAQQPTTPGPLTITTGAAGKTALQAADLHYVGSYALAGAGGLVGGADYSLSEGFTLREVNGELHDLFSGYKMIEQRVPTTLSTNPSTAPVATLLRTWSNIPATQPITTGAIKTFGLYWDPQTQLLWHGQGDEYNTQFPFQPTIGADRLNETTGAVTTLGVWGLTNRSAKMAYGGLMAIPDWFSSRYTKGRRLAAGFGFYFSIASVGPISMGPALSAFDPAVMLAAPTKTSIAHTPLVSYPFSSNCNVPRVHRDTDYIDEYDWCTPRNGVGSWTWNDQMGHCAWIDTPAKSGVLCAPVLGNGRGWYYGSTLNSERGSHAWMIYDPADLAKVATGPTLEWQIQPTTTTVRYPGVTYPLAAWTGMAPQHVVGMATEPSHPERLHIALARGWRSAPIVDVYQVH